MYNMYNLRMKVDLHLRYNSSMLAQLFKKKRASKNLEFNSCGYKNVILKQIYFSTSVFLILQYLPSSDILRRQFQIIITLFLPYASHTDVPSLTVFHRSCYLAKFKHYWLALHVFCEVWNVCQQVGVFYLCSNSVLHFSVIYSDKMSPT